MDILIKKIDGTSEEIKEVKRVCIVPQQDASRTKKEASFILDGQILTFHESKQKPSCSINHVKKRRAK